MKQKLDNIEKIDLARAYLGVVVMWGYFMINNSRLPGIFGEQINVILNSWG